MARLPAQIAHGFTMLEVIVTIAVLGLIVMLAVPNMQSVIRSNQATAQTNAFVIAINTARSTAVTRRTRVTMCTSDNYITCRSSGDAPADNWHEGWIIRLTDSGEVLQVFEPLSDFTQLSGNTGNIEYTGSGGLSSSGILNFTLTYDGCTGSGQRYIEVGPTGRVNVTVTDCT